MLNVTRSAWPRYAVAVLAVAFALFVTLALASVNQPIQVAFFYMAVVVSAYYGGLRVGVFAIVLSALVAGYFLFPPFYSLNLGLNEFLQLGIFMAVALTITLLTERSKRAEGRLQVSEGRFRQLTDNIDQVFWVYDLKQAKVVYTNPAYEIIWGDTRENLYTDHHTFFEIIHPDDRERVTASLMRQRATCSSPCSRSVAQTCERCRTPLTLYRNSKRGNRKF